MAEKRFFVGATLVLSFVILAVFTSAGFAGADTTSITNCTIISSAGSYSLANDLNGVSENPEACIAISASDVELDCGGRTVTNLGSIAGILVVNADNVVIRNCVVNKGHKQVESGGSGGPGGSNTNESGYYRYYQDSNSDGIKLFNSKNALIENNNLTRNFAGVHMYNGSDNARVFGNIANSGSNSGIFMENSNNATIENNVAIGNREHGIIFDLDSKYSFIAFNYVQGNFYGISTWGGSDAIIENNTAVQNGFSGIHLVINANSNIVLGNNVAENSYGIYLGTNVAQNAPYNNEISGNQLSGNSIGIFVREGSNHNKIIDNNFSGSGRKVVIDAVSNDNEVVPESDIEQEQQYYYENYSIDSNVTTYPIDYYEHNNTPPAELYSNGSVDAVNYSNVPHLPSSCNSGCNLNDSCYPFGYRIKDKYCSDSKDFILQVGSDENCTNNFECTSNVCVSSKCVSAGLLQRFIGWFKKLFGI